jgi:hypothetical protein
LVFKFRNKSIGKLTPFYPLFRGFLKRSSKLPLDMQNPDYINLKEVHRLKDALAGILQSVSLLDQFAGNIFADTILRKGLKLGLKELVHSLNQELGLKTKFKTTGSFHRNSSHAEDIFVYQLIIELIEAGIKTYSCSGIMFKLRREEQKLYINVRYFYNTHNPVNRSFLVPGTKLHDLIKTSEGTIVQLSTLSDHSEYLIYCKLA